MTSYFLNFAFPRFGHHVSAEHDEKHSQRKFWRNRSNCYEPGQFTLISIGLIRYSCGHISGHHESIPTKFALWMFFIMLHRYIVSKTRKCKIKKLWRHHFGTLLHLLINSSPTTKIPIKNNQSLSFWHALFTVWKRIKNTVNSIS